MYAEIAWAIWRIQLKCIKFHQKWNWTQPTIHHSEFKKKNAGFTWIFIFMFLFSYSDYIFCVCPSLRLWGTCYFVINIHTFVKCNEWGQTLTNAVPFKLQPSDQIFEKDVVTEKNLNEKSHRNIMKLVLACLCVCRWVRSCGILLATRE